MRHSPIMPNSPISNELLAASEELSKAVNALPFSPPVTHIYNPLDYANQPQRIYIERFGSTSKRVIFLGMNPGPFGMAQVGVPFGAIPAVRDWMKIEAPVGKPENAHPKRPVEGFDCKKVEVSGRRLWTELFAREFPSAEDFFREHFVLNYCPLVFMTETGANYTPDKLRVAERAPLEEHCDRHLIRALEALRPEWAIGVGGYAEKNLLRIAPGLSFSPRIARIIHPAPASPIANREWPENPRRTLKELGVWS